LKPVETSGASQVVLVLAPMGRDADLAVSVLRTAGIVAQPCKSVSELYACLRAEGNSIGALLLTEESLPSPMEYSGVTEWLEHQEPWSDMPIIFLTHPGKPTRITGQRSRVLSLRGAVTVLERPVRPGALGRCAARRAAIAHTPISAPRSTGISASFRHRTAKCSA